MREWKKFTLRNTAKHESKNLWGKSQQKRIINGRKETKNWNSTFLHSCLHKFQFFTKCLIWVASRLNIFFSILYRVYLNDNSLSLLFLIYSFSFCWFSRFCLTFFLVAVRLRFGWCYSCCCFWFVLFWFYFH